MTGALAGVRVLDLCRDLAGPYASMMLAEYGADVIEVEHPDGGDENRSWPPSANGMSGYFNAMNRSKRGIAVNLKHPDGLAAVLDIARDADIVMQSFTPGVADRLGLGYEAVRAVNPDVVYYSVSGYGQTGPWRDRRGYDPILQAASGLMSVTGEAGRGPVKTMIPVADVSTGSFGFGAVLAALIHRMKTGEGQHIDMSMLDVMVSMLSVVGTRHLMTGVIPQRNGTENPQRVPSAAFLCADNGYLQVVPNQRQWPAFCSLLGHPDWADDPRYATPTARVEHSDELYPMVRAAFATRPVNEWADALDALTIANSPINDIAQVLSLPQIVHREMVQSFDAPNGVAMPALAIPGKLSASPIRISRRPPMLGEHTREVLAEIGRSGQEIEDLVSSGAVSDGAQEGSTVA